MKRITLSIRTKALAFFTVFTLLAGANAGAQSTGTWVTLTNSVPSFPGGPEVSLLLTDGSVINHVSRGAGFGTGWNRLRPDEYMAVI